MICPDLRTALHNWHIGVLQKGRHVLSTTAFSCCPLVCVLITGRHCTIGTIGVLPKKSRHVQFATAFSSCPNYLYPDCRTALHHQHSWHTGVLPKGRHMLPTAPSSDGNSLTNASRRSAQRVDEEPEVRQTQQFDGHFTATDPNKTN